MIEGYIGIPGSGKTLSMTVRAWKQRRWYDEVITNYSINLGPRTKVRRFTEAGELQDILGGALDNGDKKKRLVLLDEVHLIFDARMWSKVPAEFLRILAQPRKAQLDMLYTAQHESQVEKRLRTVTNWLWLCRSWGSAYNMFSDKPFLFWSRCFESFEFRSPRATNYGSKVYRFRKRWGKLYDTMEVLERMDLAQLVKDGKATGVSPPEVRA